MKTLIIYNDCSEIVKFFIVDGDFSRFHNITFAGFMDDEIEIECNHWLWDSEGKFLHEMTTDKTLVENKEWDKIAIITWIP